MIRNNLGVMIDWGAIGVGLFVAHLLAAGLGLIRVFPLLGHTIWH